MTKKNLTLVWVLCFFFGAFGVHRFYLGKVKTGILMLLTLGGLGVFVLIDLFTLGRIYYKNLAIS